MMRILSTIFITKRRIQDLSEEDLEWYKAEKVSINTDILDNFDVYKLNAKILNVGDISIHHIVTGYILNHIAYNCEDNKDLANAEQSHSDLIPGVYEGGAKIWECTDDVLQYLATNFKSQEWRGKRFLDLGCGVGLLGIYVYNCGGTVHFQDYNRDVLTQITIPNVLLNLAAVKSVGDVEDSTESPEYKEIQAADVELLEEEVEFYAGDWCKYADITSNSAKFDYILTSETIYNPKNQQKLLNTIYKKLSANGVALVAAKTYYFGVGGGLRQFETVITADDRFQYKIVWSTSTEGIGREILELKLKDVRGI
ncbi:histidine protein methyltransferase 1 homolog isoform X2 [Eurosta solidaginis]|uniref:histidine protein methyltransferase 1 homolog isoform X2 n=1 Tax=Eurosta solidaginis TaxID=178769 RepID=UPI003530E979